MRLHGTPSAAKCSQRLPSYEFSKRSKSAHYSQISFRMLVFFFSYSCSEMCPKLRRSDSTSNLCMISNFELSRGDGSRASRVDRLGRGEDPRGRRERLSDRLRRREDFFMFIPNSFQDRERRDASWRTQGRRRAMERVFAELWA